MFNITDDYCKSQNTENNNIMTLIEKAFKDFLPGAIQECPLSVRNFKSSIKIVVKKMLIIFFCI